MRLFRLATIFFYFVPANVCLAYEPIVLTEGVEHVRLGPQMDYLEDADKEFSIEDVVNGPAAEKFQPLNMAFPNFGFSRSAYWFRFEIVNATDAPMDLLLEQEMAWMNLIELYIPGRSGQYDIRRAGVDFPFSEREYEHNHFLFALQAKPGETQTFYLKLESVLPIIAPLNIWEREAFWQSSNDWAYYYGFLFGSLLFAFLYNSFLFITLKEWVYFCYSLFIASIFMLYFSTEGFTFHFLLQNNPLLVNRITITFTSLAWLTLILFSVSFLETKINLPKMDRAFRILSALYITFIPVNLLNPDLSSTIFLPMALGNVTLILLLSAGVVSWLNGNRSARFYMLGTTSTFLGTSVNVLWVFGLTPANNIFYHAIGIGTLIDVILLSFALSDRVKILREEKELAQVAAIESEKAARQIETRAKEELETKVEERTCELAGEKERAEQSREQAEAANKLKDQFVTLVSHDLRAPLGNIMGLMELFREKTRGAALDGRHLNLLDRAANNCNGLIGMIDRLLDISRLRSGKMRVAKQFILTRYMLEDRIERLTHSAQEKMISITMDIPQGHRIFADENLFGEVVQNIVSNAIKFLDEGGQVTIRAEEGPSGAIVITDNGPGIGGAILPDIFNAHKKTSTRGTKGEKGMGLGLPLSQDIMKAHGGKIQVESQPGAGATFRLTLPEAKVTALVVDDNEATRVEVADQLRAMQVDVVEAANGAEALDRIAEQTPHVVIADILMPQMDGWALLNFIRKSPSMDGVPVIMFTSSDEIAAREKAFRLGASDFVMKPIVTNDFIPRVRRFVRV